MRTNFGISLALVLKHEGGFVHHPSDPGGATMKGVTLRVFREHFGRDRTIPELKAISDEQIEQVYRSGYWDICNCGDLPYGLDYAVFDFAVNSGPGRSAKYLQEVLGVKADGRIGPVTLEALSKYGEHDALVDLFSNRLRYLKSLQNWNIFGRGWYKRVVEAESTALLMLLKN